MKKKSKILKICLIKMKHIILNTGEKVLIDDEDYDFINQWKWSFRFGYAVRCEDGKTIIMHRVINNTPDGKITDHVNRNPLDNRRSNLRTCNYSQNAMNRGSCKNTTSRHKGVYWCKRVKKWIAEITSNYKRTKIGEFEDEDSAAMAYNEMALKLHDKRFVGLNQI